MRYGYPALSGVITDPAKALPKILMAYFKASTEMHGVAARPKSLRYDLNTGTNSVDAIRNSLDTLLSAYFDVYTLDLQLVKVEGSHQYMELEITVTDDGKVINFEKVLEVEGNDLKALLDQGHL